MILGSVPDGRTSAEVLSASVNLSMSATGSEALVKCDTLILDRESKSDTYPNNICKNKESFIEHEATVSRISEEKLFYMMLLI